MKKYKNYKHLESKMTKPKKYIERLKMLNTICESCFDRTEYEELTIIDNLYYCESCYSSQKNAKKKKFFDYQNPF